jgi:hypothetical protein
LKELLRDWSVSRKDGSPTSVNESNNRFRTKLSLGLLITSEHASMAAFAIRSISDNLILIPGARPLDAAPDRGVIRALGRLRLQARIPGAQNSDQWPNEDSTWTNVVPQAGDAAAR